MIRKHSETEIIMNNECVNGAQSMFKEIAW